MLASEHARDRAVVCAHACLQALSPNCSSPMHTPGSGTQKNLTSGICQLSHTLEALSKTRQPAKEPHEWDLPIESHTRGRGSACQQPCTENETACHDVRGSACVLGAFGLGYIVRCKTRKAARSSLSFSFKVLASSTAASNSVVFFACKLSSICCLRTLRPSFAF